MKLRAALVLGAGGLVGCAAQRSTERVFDGHAVVGPYIEPEAYAAFAEGVYRERHGDIPGALGAYRRAQQSDPQSPAIAVRIGALICPSDLDDALAELDTSGLGRDYAPAWVERSRCCKRHGQPDEALSAARHAVMLDDGDAEANLLVAELLRERREMDAASAWLFAWLLNDPGAASYRATIEVEAQKLGDGVLAALVRSSPSTADDSIEPEVALPSPSERARAPSADPALALTEARRVLAANPADAEALVVALSAAHRLGDEQTFAELLRRAQPTLLASEELAARWIELLRQRTGDAAANAWAEAYRARAVPPRAAARP